MNVSAEASGSNHPRYSEVDSFGYFSNSFASMAGNARVADPQVMGNLWLSGPQLWPSNQMKDPFKPNEVLSYRLPEKNIEEMRMEKIVKNQGQLEFVLPLNGNTSEISKPSVNTIDITIPPKGGPVGENHGSYQCMPLVFNGTQPESYPGLSAPPIVFFMQNVGDASGHTPNHLNGKVPNERFVLPLGHDLKREEVAFYPRKDGRMNFRACESSHVRNGNSSQHTVMQTSSPSFHKPDPEYATRALEPTTNGYEGPQAWVNRGDGWKCINLKGQM